MVTITDAALRQNVYETIYDILAAGSYTTTDTPTVTAAYIDKDQAFPQIVLHPISAELTGLRFGKTPDMRQLNVMIDIWTKKNKDQDILADEINALLEDYAYTGINLIGIDEAVNFETPNNNKLHLRTLTLTFVRGH